jgi:hypothetical protein
MFLGRYPIIDIESWQPYAKLGRLGHYGDPHSGSRRLAALRGLGRLGSVISDEWLPIWQSSASYVTSAGDPKNAAILAAGLDAAVASGLPAGFINNTVLANGYAGNMGLSIAPGFFLVSYQGPGGQWYAQRKAGSVALLSALGRGYAGDMVQVYDPVSLVPASTGAVNVGAQAASTAIGAAITKGDSAGAQAAVDSLVAALRASPGTNPVVPSPAAKAKPDALTAVLPMQAPGVDAAAAQQSTYIAHAANMMAANGGGGIPVYTGPPTGGTGGMYQSGQSSGVLVDPTPTVTNWALWLGAAAVALFAFSRR